ncbi:MAG: type II toxin-antitoxin system RelE/ParE family toxin [Candidatus Acidiferrales bacterium]
MVRRRVRVVWLGDSMDVLSTFSDEAKFQLGTDLERMQNGEQPLDFSSMASVLPGVIELRDEDKDFWYRVFCFDSQDSVFVLHCFRKTTNQTSPRDIAMGKARRKLAREIIAGRKRGTERAKNR